MKNQILPLAVFLSFSLFSCTNDKNVDLPDSESESPKLVMEVSTHVRTLEKYACLNAERHGEFITKNLVGLLSNDEKAFKILYAPEDSIRDTLYSIDEIPVFNETKSLTKYFTDGTMTSEVSNLTPVGANPAEQFTETPENPSMKSVKTIIRDNRLISYNREGLELVNEDLPQQNYAQFLDTVEYYVTRAIASGEPMTVSALQKVQQLNSNLPGFNFESEVLTDGRVQITQYLENKSPLQKISGEQLSLKAVSTLNHSMSKLLDFKVYSGNQLMQRKSFAYSISPQLRNSVYKEDCYGENPQYVKTETLTLSPSGTPVILEKEEFYLQNKSDYYFKCINSTK